MNSSRIKSSSVKLKKQLDLKTYRDIFVFENFSLRYDDGELITEHLRNNNLGPAVELETLAEASFALYNFTRLSRLKGIDLNKIEDGESLELERKGSTQRKFPTQEEIRTWREWLL